jgi:hypothetical protein
MEARKGSDVGATGGSWLLMLVHMPTDDPAPRMRVLRTLEALGAVVMRDGAFLLPDSPANRSSLEALSDYIGRSAGNVHVLNASALSSAQHDSLKRLFDRSQRYEELVKTVEGLKLGFGQSDPSAIARVLHKQRRDFDSIASLDFFPTEARARAERALAECDTAVRKLLNTASVKATLGPGENLRQRTWATRRPLWADRLACAWLIRRFIDPEATLFWLDKNQEVPAGAVGFAFDGAHFANTETRVTYEEMVARMELGANAALGKIAGIVRFLEARGDPVPEAAGVQMLLQGAMRRSPTDDELLGEAEKTFDLLYDAYQEPARR